MGRSKGTIVGFAALALAAACGETTPATTGGGGATASGSAASSSSAATSSAAVGAGGAGGAGTTAATTSAVVGAGGFGGSDAFVCNPAAEPGSIFEREADVFGDVAPTPMCKYRGDVMLIVNTAALCGYTPQYTPLELLESTFKAQGLHVLGFLSNDFGNQGGTDGQVEACKDQYKVTFDQFAIDKVTTPATSPVFAWLEAQMAPGPVVPNDPTWNFHKYLISREGKLVAHWASADYPGDDPSNPNDSFDTSPIVMAIKAELAKPKP
jgi:glutathione peroxidase